MKKISQLLFTVFCLEFVFSCGKSSNLVYPGSEEIKKKRYLRDNEGYNIDSKYDKDFEYYYDRKQVTKDKKTETKAKPSLSDNMKILEEQRDPLKAEAAAAAAAAKKAEEKKQRQKESENKSYEQ